MAKCITIEDVDLTPEQEDNGLKKGQVLVEELEAGNILLFPNIPFPFAKEDKDFLLSQKQKASSNRKNIAYKPHADKVTNMVQESKEQQDRMLSVMRAFTHNVKDFLGKVLTPYSSLWQLDYASFRPFQEKGRNLRTRARNDLLHTDAFPSRPMHGTRILRFFVNINPDEPRKWVTSDSFETLAKKFGGTERMPFPKIPKSSVKRRLRRMMKTYARKSGFPVSLRSPYDDFMLRFHHFLKENEDFQKNGTKDYWEFPPNSCWMVFTDSVSHAALQGKYALEQTFLIPRKALLNPEKSPVSILERLTGEIMVDHVLAGRKSML